MPKRNATKPQTLKHLPFFEVLAQAPQDSGEAKLATAGLLTLRMVDHWVLAGAAIVEPESVSVRSVRSALMALPPEEPVREALLMVVNTMQMLRNVDLVPVLPRVYAYGQILERHHGAMALAADVYETVIRLADLEFDTELVLDSYTRLAFCQRKAGALDDAEATSRTLVKLAERRKDRVHAIWGKMGIAQVAMLRGEYGAADTQLEAIAQEAQRHDLTPQLAAALHNQSVVASRTQNPWRASVLANRALRLTTDLAERDRILGDLGAYLVAAGDYSAALDAFRILQVTASQEEPRLAATGNIAITAARMGNRELFDAAIRDIAIDRLPHDAQVAFLVEVAAGYRRFGESALADFSLDDAKRRAARYGLSPDVADEARAQPVTHAKTQERAPDVSSDAALEVSTTLRELATALVR